MNDQIGLKEAWEQLLAYDPAVWIGVFTAIVVFVIEIVLYKKGIIFSGGEKKIAEAKAKGNVLSATRIKCRYYDKSSGARNYVATYEYELNGLHTKKVVTSNSMPPLKITLYCDNGKVFLESDIDSSPVKLLMYIIPVIAAIMVMMALGFKG